MLHISIPTLINTIKTNYKPYLWLFVVSMLIGSLLYFPLISNGLVNSDDGIWEYNYYKSGSWSLSLGRWLIMYIDRLHFGIALEPFSSLASLAFFSIGLLFILHLFELIQKKIICILVVLLFFSNASILICFSYRFMSHSFALAFLFSCISAFSILKIKKWLFSIILGSGFLTLSMGLYQAYIACTCIIILCYIISQIILLKITIKDFFHLILKCIISIIVGGLLYNILLHLQLNFFHISLSSYGDANSYTIPHLIQSLSFSIENTYRVFSRYFIDGYFKISTLQDYYIIHAVLICFLFFLLYKSFLIFKTSKGLSILLLFCIICIPVAANATLLIAVTAWTSLQMTSALALTVPLLVCIMFRSVPILRIERFITYLSNSILLLFLYGCIYQVQLDQESMRIGSNTTTSIVNEVISELIDLNYYDEDYIYCIYGAPSQSPLFYTSRLYEKGNGYALFGNWISSYDRLSWKGAIHHLTGTNLTVGESYDYSYLETAYDIKSMPVFPYEGSIIKDGIFILIHIS